MDGQTDGRTDGRMNGRTDRRTDGHIILPLRGFEPMVCGRMSCAQLRAAQMITKKRRGRLDRKTKIWTYKLNWTPLGSFGPQCGDKLLPQRLYSGSCGRTTIHRVIEAQRQRDEQTYKLTQLTMEIISNERVDFNISWDVIRHCLKAAFFCSEAAVIIHHWFYSGNCFHIACRSENIIVLGSPQVFDARTLFRFFFS